VYVGQGPSGCGGKAVACCEVTWNGAVEVSVVCVRELLCSLGCERMGMRKRQ